MTYHHTKGRRYRPGKLAAALAEYCPNFDTVLLSLHQTPAAPLAETPAAPAPADFPTPAALAALAYDAFLLAYPEE